MTERRGSILDLFLTFLLLLCIVGGFLRMRELRVQAAPVKTAPHTLTLTVEKLSPQTAGCIAVGETVYTESGAVLGRVTAKETRPARVTLVQNGDAVSGEWDPALFVELRLEVEVDATVGERGLLLHATTPLSVGETLTLCTERTALRVILYEITSNSP